MSRSITRVAPEFLAITTLLSKSGNSYWLAANLQLIAPAIAGGKLAAGASPTRNEMIEQLGGLKRAVNLVSTKLQDPTIMGALWTVSMDEGFDANVLIRQLPAVSNACSKALAQIPTGRKGARRAELNPDGIDPEILCALTIIEAHKLLHGHYPGKDGPAVNEAADKFWEASVGAPFGRRPGAGDWSGRLREALALVKRKAITEEKGRFLNRLRFTLATGMPDSVLKKSPIAIPG